MNFIYFVSGYALGFASVCFILFLHKTGENIVEGKDTLLVNHEAGQTVQFIDPVTQEDKYKSAEKIDDMLSN